MLGGFLGCSATPDLKECLLLPVTSETWRSSLPPCQHFFLSRGPAQCWKLPVCWVSPSLPSLLWAPSSISYLHELSCSFQLFLLFWARDVFCSQSTSSGNSPRSFMYATPSFLDYMWYNHRHWKSQFWSFTSHPTYPDRAIKETITRTWFQHWQLFFKAKLSSAPKVETHKQAQLWETWSTVRCQEHVKCLKDRAACGIAQFLVCMQTSCVRPCWFF